VKHIDGQLMQQVISREFLNKMYSEVHNREGNLFHGLDKNSKETEDFTKMLNCLLMTSLHGAIMLGKSDILKEHIKACIKDLTCALTGIEKGYTKDSNLLFNRRYMAECDNFLIEKVCEKLALNPDTTMTEQERAKLMAYLEDIDIENVYFHGFSGANKKSIEENGLQTDNAGRNDENDMAWEIHELFKKYGTYMSRGCIGIDRNNVSLGQNPLVFNYARNSPEWFYIFINNFRFGDGFGGFTGMDGKHTEQLKNGFAEKMRELNFSPEDFSRFNFLFDKIWNKYVDQQPYVAVTRLEDRKVDRSRYIGEEDAPRSVLEFVTRRRTREYRSEKDVSPQNLIVLTCPHRENVQSTEQSIQHIVEETENVK